MEPPVQPFTDSSYPASSLPGAQGIAWMRLREIDHDFTYIEDDHRTSELSPGELGSSHVLTVLSYLQHYPAIFNRVRPKLQSQQAKSEYHFNFFFREKWQMVAVDDKLPFQNDRLALTISEDEHEFWPALLEKAFIKFCGGCEVLEERTTALDVLADLTGGSCELLSCDTTDVSLAVAKSALVRGSLVGCQLQFEDTDSSGIYAVTMITAKNVKTGQLLRLQRPLDGTAGSKLWQHLLSHNHNTTGGTPEDGAVWLSASFFREHVGCLLLCHVAPNPSGLFSWELAIAENSWRSRVSAGGGPDYDTIWSNPQYRLVIPGDKTASALVSLRQFTRVDTDDDEWRSIGFSIYEIPEDTTAPLPASFFSRSRKPIQSSEYEARREISCRVQLKPGSYCLIPSTSEPGAAADFTIRIFTEVALTLQELDDVNSYKQHIGDPEEYLTEQERQELDQLRWTFRAHRGADHQLNAFELQEVLGAAFMRGNARNPLARRQSSQSGPQIGYAAEFIFRGFSVETCRTMITYQDIDSNGTMGFNEFLSLCNELRYLKNCFKEHLPAQEGPLAPPRDPLLEAANFRAALATAGMTFTNEAAAALILRYANRTGQVEFDEYVHCVLRLKTLWGEHTSGTPGMREIRIFCLL